MKCAIHAAALIAALVSNALAQPAPPRTYAQQTAGLGRHDGFIPFYFDERSGKLLFEVQRIDQDFLYLYSLSTGLGSNDRGLDRGARYAGDVKQSRNKLAVVADGHVRSLAGQMPSPNRTTPQSPIRPTDFTPFRPVITLCKVAEHRTEEPSP